MGVSGDRVGTVFTLYSVVRKKLKVVLGVHNRKSKKVGKPQEYSISKIVTVGELRVADKGYVCALDLRQTRINKSINQ